MYNDFASQMYNDDSASTSSAKLYLDFSRYADGYTGQNGRDYESLRSQLQALRRKYGTEFFPNYNADKEDILDYFQEHFFPDGFMMPLFVSNLSLNKYCRLHVRPAQILPHIEDELPSDLTLILSCGFNGLFKSTNGQVANPILYVDKIIDSTHSEKRNFETEINVQIVTESDLAQPWTRIDNIITQNFVESLPPISQLTKQKLKDWNDYLDWKERYVKSQLVGLQYINVKIIDGYLQFLVVAESEQDYHNKSRIFRNDNIMAFDKSYSTDKWNFTFNKNFSAKGIELGDVDMKNVNKKVEKNDIAGELKNDIPFKEPYFAKVCFALNENMQNDFDPNKSQKLLGHFPRQGFLAPSAIGDLALIRRLKSMLRKLEEQSGYAPFLSSYLFDMTQARQPKRLVAVTEWMSQDLNEDQKEAVRRIVSAPDIALLQGPPGTGKTTVIAESVFQFLKQGKSVLVTSQANLAVDNALERLAKDPSIRAVRLGKKGETESPYHQNNALGTYYKSIAANCRTKTLDRWDELDRQNNRYEKWLDDTGLVWADIENLQQHRNDIEKELNQCKSAIQKIREQEQQAEKEKQIRNSLMFFGQLLDGNTANETIESIEVLPSTALQTFFENIVLPVMKLCKIGIQLNTDWLQLDYGTLEYRSVCAVQIMKAWLNLLKEIPQLEVENERLKTATRTILSPEITKKIDALEQHKSELEDNLTQDNLAEFKRIKEEIKAIKQKNNANIDTEFFKRVFNYNEAWKPFVLPPVQPNILRSIISSITSTRPNSTTEIQQKDLMQTAINTIKEVHQQVEIGLKNVRCDIDRFLCQPVSENNCATLIQEEARKCQVQTQKLAEVNLQIRDKQAILLPMMNEEGTYTSTADFPVLRQRIAKLFADTQSQIENQKAIRTEWQDIVKDWVTDLENEKTSRQDNDGYSKKAFIESCNVIGVTCTENVWTLTDAGHVRFDVAIIDEVSKATPPEFLMPMSLAKTTILVGDHRQLPPLFKEKNGNNYSDSNSFEEVLAEAEELQDSESQNNQLTPENFQRFEKMVTASLFKEHFENAPESLKVYLWTQYRMHPDIMNVVNRFYDNRLQCGLTSDKVSVSRQHLLTLKNSQNQIYLTPKQHAVWIDSEKDPFGRPYFETKKGNGKTNHLEALLIAKMICDMELAYRQQGYGKSKPKKQIAVISFYGKQLAEIRNAINTTKKQMKINEFAAIAVKINTVDRFQGQESPIVFVSMVRHPQWKLSARANTAQYERINVAFSRAQELLVIVGSAKTFLEYPVELPNLNKPGKTKIDVYKQIIDEIRFKGSFRVANEVIRSNEWQQLHTQSARQSTGQSFQPQSKRYFSLHSNPQQTYSK